MNLGEYLVNLLLEQDQKIIALFPGAFKPPHKGHFAVVKDLADQADEVVVLISPKQRGGISAEESFAVWELYKPLLPDNVSFKIAAESPVSETYDVIKNNPDTKFIVAFGKGESDRFNQINTSNKYPNATVYNAGEAEEGVNATGLRNAIANDNGNEIEKYIPQGIDIIDFRSALNVKQPLRESPPIEFEQDDYQDYIANNRAAIEKAAGYFNVPIPDMEYAFNAGQPVVLGDDVWSQLQNTNSFNIENLDHAIRYAHDKKIKVKPYILAIKNNKELPLPLILRYGQDKYWLVAGETILSLYKALKATPTVLQATLNLREVQTYIQPKPEKKQIIKEFIKYVAKELELTTLPRIKFSTDNEEVKNRRSFGYYNPGQNIIWVYTKNRNMADMLRTLAHELVHHKQNIDGRIYNNSGETGSEIENEANAKAGIILRNFGKQNNMIYEGKGLYPKVKIAPTPKGQFLQNADVKIVVVDEKGKTIKAVNELKEKYEIYCDMDGVLVDFERGYEELTGKNIRGNHVKGDADFWQPITDAGVEFWTKLKWMSDGKQLWNYIKKHKPSLLSAPSREESSRIGKHIWVENNTPGVNLILRAADKKQEFASPNAILIDDRADNIQRWKDAGGVGILHTSAENTINELEKLGL
jgi:cytidyltransferase-like protein